MVRTTIAVTLIAGLGLLMNAGLARAQDQPELYAKPLPQHETLKKEVGTWDATMNLFMGGPDAPPTTYKAVETVKLLEGGLWTMGEYRGELFGREFVGRSFLGYDPEKGKYVTSWVDNMAPKLTILEGTYDSATRTLTMLTDGKDPATGKPIKEKHTHLFKDDDNRTFKMSHTGEDGKEVVLMEVVYKRRK
jgi:hypothetical protein